ncbi:hypothetical protein ACE1OC_43360 (plasmid) [Streptomyces sp. DSM 116496]|uniref:hypothetical protein n=1 Tax=Streptomyces stoeckheimensis TaxID=3344656 RepID=UPI0038B38618
MTDAAKKILVDTADLGAVDLSRFQAAMEQQSRQWRVQLGQQLASAVAAMTPVFPRISIPPMVELDRVSKVLGQQLVELTGFNDRLRRAFEPVIEPLTAAFAFDDLWRDQWRDLFTSINRLVRDLYPENIREALPRLRELQMLEVLLIDEGIPLMWVPGSQTVNALLDAPDAAARRRLIGQRWKGIVADCEVVLETVDHPRLQEGRDFALGAVAALRDGHTAAAQALAANLLDSMLQKHFDNATRVELTRNDFKAKGIKFKLDEYRVSMALTFAPVWHAHAKYFPKNGDPIPRVFGRHPSAHGVSRMQYSRVNTVYALMLVTSVIKFFDVEMS